MQNVETKAPAACTSRVSGMDGLHEMVMVRTYNLEVHRRCRLPSAAVQWDDTSNEKAMSTKKDVMTKVMLVRKEASKLKKVSTVMIIKKKPVPFS